MIVYKLENISEKDNQAHVAVALHTSILTYHTDFTSRL